MWGSVGALIFCILIAFFKGFNYFVDSSVAGGTYGAFDYKNFITAYLGIPLYIIMIFGYKLIMKSQGVKPATADLYSGKARIDEEEIEYLEAERLKNDGKPQSKLDKIYERTIGAVF